MLKFIHFLRTPTPISPLLFRKPFSPKPLRFLRYSSSAAVDTLTADAAETLCASHPWPEWVNFVDRLKSKGYFVESPPEANHEGDAESAYNDMNLVKDACFSFARDRYDVFKYVHFLCLFPEQMLLKNLSLRFYIFFLML
jgi:hypothetical protein